MVQNRATNDEDFVPPTQYPKLLRQAKRKPPPYFEPLPILNESTYSTPNLPPHINTNNPYQLFELFWTDELLDKLVEYTNRNVELHQTPKDKKPKSSP